MQTAKQEALKAIQRLPDTADTEEIMYLFMYWTKSGRASRQRLKVKPLPAENYRRKLKHGDLAITGQRRLKGYP